MNSIKEIVDLAKGIGSDGWNTLKTIAKFLNYLMHPKLIIQALWHFIDIYSFWICLAVALVCIILYGLGYKKFAKYVPTSMAIYSLIKVIGSAF
ncbi:hypothetical protein [Clostridium sp. YIM B02551]|uniref:hypothetical protein n=1 Tax=Clostridium sp. YIM B02551 TaxID=2910679 RepID=UPI001EECE086|nr:hypothetical protein [Clostridium sp. YIM B02551]